jgi:hypothetical protein
MALRELLEPKHAAAAQSKLAKCGAPHCAKTEDNRVIPLMARHH